VAEYARGEVLEREVYDGELGCGRFGEEREEVVERNLLTVKRGGELGTGQYVE
jgi:hypothetical protein